MPHTPAIFLKDVSIEVELRNLWIKWDTHDFRDEGGGSPGEWIVERIGALETEQERRAAGGELPAELPLQSQ